MLSLFRLILLSFCLIFLMVLAFHFFSPEKDLVTGSVLRLRIKVGALADVFAEESSKSYQRVRDAKREDVFNTLRVEGKNLSQKLLETGEKNSFVAYLGNLKAVTGNLLATVKQEIQVLSSATAPQPVQKMPVSLGDYSRAVQTWLAINDKRLNAIQGIEGDELEAREKAEIARLQEELRVASNELERLVNLTPEARSGPSVTLDRRPDVSRTEAKPSEDSSQALASDAALPAAPDNVLSMFKDRYLSRDIRKTPYHFRNLKILKSAEARIPGVYCVSFSSDVYNNHDKKKWDRSPVVLNVIVSMGADGIMSSYENFARNPWEYPVTGACVKPIWGIHEYLWEDVCPYGCLAKE